MLEPLSYTVDTQDIANFSYFVTVIIPTKKLLVKICPENFIYPHWILDDKNVVWGMR